MQKLYPHEKLYARQMDYGPKMFDLLKLIYEATICTQPIEKQKLQSKLDTIQIMSGAIIGKIENNS